jgi:hypothetical protein
MTTYTHWAPWDAPRTKRTVLAACGKRVDEGALVKHGVDPTCIACLGRFLEFERLNITDTGA